MIGLIHHIGIRVRDFERMVSFYRAAFGFEVVGEEFGDREKGGARLVMTRADNCYIEIISTPTSDEVQTPTVEGG